MKKEKAINTINEFPPEFALDELLEKLIFVEKIEKGLKQLGEENTVSHEKVEEIIKEW